MENTRLPGMQYPASLLATRYNLKRQMTEEVVIPGNCFLSPGLPGLDCLLSTPKWPFIRWIFSHFTMIFSSFSTFENSHPVPCVKDGVAAKTGLVSVEKKSLVPLEG